MDLKEQLCSISPIRYLDIIVNILGAMNRDGVNEYSFVHHHVRDYFAAYYIVQRIWETLAINDCEIKLQNRYFIPDEHNGIAAFMRQSALLVPVIRASLPLFVIVK